MRFGVGVLFRTARIGLRLTPAQERRCLRLLGSGGDVWGVDRCEPGPVPGSRPTDLWVSGLVWRDRRGSGRGAVGDCDALGGPALLGCVFRDRGAQTRRGTGPVSASQAGPGAAALVLGHLPCRAPAGSPVRGSGRPGVLGAPGASDPVSDRVAALGDPPHRRRATGARRHRRSRTSALQVEVAHPPLEGGWQWTLWFLPKSQRSPLP